MLDLYSGVSSIDMELEFSCQNCSKEKEIDPQMEKTGVKPEKCTATRCQRSHHHMCRPNITSISLIKVIFFASILKLSSASPPGGSVAPSRAAGNAGNYRPDLETLSARTSWFPRGDWNSRKALYCAIFKQIVTGLDVPKNRYAATKRSNSPNLPPYPRGINKLIRKETIHSITSQPVLNVNDPNSLILTDPSLLSLLIRRRRRRSLSLQVRDHLHQTSMRRLAEGLRDRATSIVAGAPARFDPDISGGSGSNEEDAFWPVNNYQPPLMSHAFRLKSEADENSIFKSRFSKKSSDGGYVLCRTQYYCANRGTCYHSTTLGQYCFCRRGYSGVRCEKRDARTASMLQELKTFLGALGLSTLAHTCGMPQYADAG